MGRNHKASIRSRGSSSSSASNPRKRVRECCRKFVAFMCTQVGVGALIVVYAIVGALSFRAIEMQLEDDSIREASRLRKNISLQLWDVTVKYNLFNHSDWETETDVILKIFQFNITELIKEGYSGRTPQEIWSFPAALMYCLSVFTMIGYGNMVPRTPWGKGVTVIYATFGIPLYILYFLNMGKVLAQSFKFLYTTIHECTHDNKDKTDDDDDDDNFNSSKKIIVPSTACLWVITFYILTGTTMFAHWEKWSYLDSIYFCMTSLCKIGFGDFVPGAKIVNALTNESQNITEIVELTSTEKEKEFLELDSQTKFAINFLYMLIGMSLVAMCYNLMREEVRVKFKELEEDFKLAIEDLKVRFGQCCGREHYNENYYYY
ncbi:TWiK family of potassium channels protein 18 [Condylostylus longicornis]|uniref:TWiK family of potassium channels protein 18 n=1 Tax=Condylostylus longicornis TaxID=2530218 RepID=UPI00244E4C0A|nr:TWiK family of potassium channels protein 18 [Condylostylus longicornis]